MKLPEQWSIVVVGAGSFGSALASLLAENDHHVTLVARNQNVVEEINNNQQNSRYLPGVQLSDKLRAVQDTKVVNEADLVLLTVPSHAMRSTCKSIKDHLPSDVYVVHATKGLEVNTLKRMSEVIHDELPHVSINHLAVLSGPSHAEEVSRGLPTTIVAASISQTTAELVQDLFMGRNLRVYTNPDITGVELGGSLKNIIALGCGISDGLQFGDNAKAALLTRGLVEITRLGLSMGASFSTFSGLTGIGDLIVTGTSKHSRNWQAGYLLGQGFSVEAAIAKVGMVVEGIKTTQAAVRLAEQYAVQMPIASTIYQILFEGQNPKLAVEELMGRSRRHEVEEFIQESTLNWQNL
jgi:glycerol-3-phosphate dehydrogenase (NAD(P)+)